MDFNFDEEQGDLRALARRILEAEATVDRLRRAEAAEVRFDRDLWATLGEAGLIGIALPEEVGGGGYGVVEQCIVLEEAGRVLAPVPLLASSVLGAAPIAAFGTPEQRSRWVSPATTGDLILTGALIEPLKAPATSPVTRAQRDGGSWVLNGVKTCVPAGTLAGLVVVPAMTDDGLAVLLVEPSQVGVTVEAQRTFNGETEARISFDDVRVADDAMLAGADRGLEVVEWMVERAMLGLAAHQLGIVDRGLAITADYVNGRVQFGRPIGSFQAVAQRMADCYIDVQGVRLTLQQAMWRASEGLSSRTQTEVAKFWAAEAGHNVAHAIVHLHGGMGIATEGDIHRYYLAAKQNEFALGGATDQLLRIGAELASSTVR